MKSSQDRTIKSVEIILHPSNAGWILEKIAKRLQEEWVKRGLDVSISDKPTRKSDVGFWMYFGHKGLIDKKNQDFYKLRSAFVTHVDDAAKVRDVKDLLEAEIAPVFMSKSHSETVASLVKSRNRLFHTRFGSDFASERPNFKIGWYSKRFPDGRKNEAWLMKFASTRDLRNVEFEFIGLGWTDVAKSLRNRGAIVNVFDGVENVYPEYRDFPKFYRDLDLYINLGFDEGAMGALDAFLMNVPMLVSKHGYHEEFDVDKTQLFSDYEEFERKFEAIISMGKRQAESRMEWTWESTASEIFEYWTDLLKGQTMPQIESTSMTGLIVQDGNYSWSMRAKFLFRAIDRRFRVKTVHRIKKLVSLIFGNK